MILSLSYFITVSSIIKAIEYYLPPTTVTNAQLAEEFNGAISPVIFDKTGVDVRHIVEKDTACSSLAFHAAEKLFAENNIDRNAIDALVYCCAHPDYITPPTSCVLQHQLRLKQSLATYDLMFGCSGYTYSLSLVKSIMATLGFRNVLLLTATVLTKYIHPKDRASRILFGDAASATLFTSGDEGTGIGNFVFGTDGGGADKIIIKHGGDLHKVTHESLTEKTDDYGNIYSDAHYFMNSQEVLLFSLKRVPALIQETIQKNNFVMTDIDLYVLHQANKFMNEQVRNMTGIEKEKFYLHMSTTGNTVQATIPIALKAAIAEGRIKDGSKVLVAGFGVGLSWSATVINF